MQGNEKRTGDRDSSKFSLQIDQIIVFEDNLLGPGMNHSLDHTCMVELIGEDDTSREFASEGAHYPQR